jgi:hypothetical protein
MLHWPLSKIDVYVLADCPGQKEERSANLMKSYAIFRRNPFGEVVARTNEDRRPWEVVPYGRFGAGVWTGHPIELVVVLGIVVIGLIGIPVWRWFFAATVLVGGLIGYALWRRHQPR